MSTELMKIGKNTLIKKEWSWGTTMHLEHEEVESDIDIEQAKELVSHLQQFIEEEESNV